MIEIGCTSVKKLNKIETIISSLKPGEAIHLGHSSVVGNFGGVRVGLDLTTTDGWIPAPFSNLILGNSTRISHLLPLIDVEQMVARPHIAKYLDVILYSHLHPDHFSLDFVAQAKAANPKLRVISPVGTKEYIYHLEESVHFKENIVSKLFMFPYRKIIEPLKHETEEQKSARRRIVNQIEEISPKSGIVIENKGISIFLTASEAIHPSYQFYLRTSYESVVPPPVTYYRLDYLESEHKNCAFLIGETAIDPELFFDIFNKRGELKIVFLPITEQSSPKGMKFVEGYFAHQSLLALSLIERIVTKGTKLVLLHQGLWYFELTSKDIDHARLSLEKFSSRKAALPFVDLTREFLSINTFKKKWKLLDILLTAPARRKKFDNLAKYASRLPINGEIDGLPIGNIIRFGYPTRSEMQLSVDAIKAALDVHLAEYQALSAEIESGWEIQKTLLQYTLLIIGTVITLVTAFPNTALLYLVASIMLSLLGWGYIEQSIRMTTIGRYYKQILSPRMNQLIQTLNHIDLYQPIDDQLKVMNWEDFFRAGNIRTALMGVSAGGKFAYAVLPGIAFVIAFYFTKSLGAISWTSLEAIGFVFTASLSLLPLATLMFNTRFSFTGEE